MSLYSIQYSEKESLKGMFYIVKGQYREVGEKVIIDDESMYLGGYNPEDDRTVNWYRVEDNVVHYSVYCGSSYEEALRAITNAIKGWKTRRNYFKHVCRTTTEDYYEVHYLHHKPLTPDQREKKREKGICPRISPKMQKLEDEIYKRWGDYYIDDIERAEDEALKLLENLNPQKKLKKIARKTLTKVGNSNVSSKESTFSAKTTKVEKSGGLKKFKVMKIKRIG